MARIALQVDVFTAVAFIMGRISANGLVVVIVGALAGVATFDVVVGDIVVVSRQPPNHPYFTHDVVGKSVVNVDELVEVEVVVSSRHPANISSKYLAIMEIHIPHHPGVLQVVVRVGVAVVELVLLVVLVDGSLPLL